ncbi:MAG TPA: hypothetical protein PLP73_04105 [Candidatus Absconditabacterales bacterium]|nr:hypothetical protein [Candidatus Absconditabacterales bacterium]HRU50539.1 hypothetical protein [Candidatus Absconditabacterales bacterium]
MSDYKSKLEKYEESYKRPSSQKVNDILKEVDSHIADILLTKIQGVDKNKDLFYKENLDILYKVKMKLLKSDLNGALKELEGTIYKDIIRS